jgi:hypothetical protein
MQHAFFWSAFAVPLEDGAGVLGPRAGAVARRNAARGATPSSEIAAPSAYAGAMTTHRTWNVGPPAKHLIVSNRNDQLQSNTVRFRRSAGPPPNLRSATGGQKHEN